MRSIQAVPKDILMAILKHIAVKNADYSEGQRYLIFKHDKKTKTDGHNGSGNIHTYIMINSVRKYDVEQ